MGLLACSGLRSSEALELQFSDWEPGHAVLTIRQTKFGQSRYVPVSKSAAKILISSRLASAPNETLALAPAAC